MEFGILGPLRVTAEGAELDLGGPRRRALLALLLVEANRAVPAAALVEQLWEGEPPSGAAGTLQSHVSHLRRSIGRDRIETHGAAYRLRVDAGELDAGAFEADGEEGRRLLAAGAPDEAAEVLGCGLARWRGQALADAGGASWILAEARRLEELRLVATESLLEAQLAAGRNAEVAATAQAAIAEHPLRERLWAHLLVALYRDGRQADALRAYQRLREQLAEELGIDPSPELRALESAILAQDTGLSPEVVARPEPSPAPPAALPGGVVTFLLTDVVGSTRLWESAPDAMSRALARHDALLQAAVEAHDGTLLKARGEGDSTFSVFQRATDAVAAARRADVSFTAEPWPQGAEIRVRAAIHTGEVHERDGDYYGRAVNRAARLRGMAEAGQILLSRPTADLVIDHLPNDCSVVELGTRQLPDLERSETVFVLAGDVTEPPDLADERRPELAFPRRLASARAPRFVGRLEETETTERRRKEALAGEPRVLLVDGEPGIGKTSLAAEVASRAHADGAMVLYGRCDPDLGVAYLPWVEAVEQLVSQCPVDRLRAIDARTLADLARLVPALSDRLPGVRPAPPSDPDGDRYQLFGAVTAALATTAATLPVVVVLDDLHWADKPTLMMLRHVVSAASGRLLLIGTYRPSDLTPEHALTDLLAVLRREPRVERVALEGLPDEDVVSLVEALSGQQIAGAELDLVHAVQRETDGNPFFTVELLQHLTETGVVTHHEDGRWTVVADPGQVGLPESIREVVGHRVLHLGELGHRVLEAAAVIGRTFQLDVLEGTVEAGEDDVLTALERAEAATLVVGVAPGEFSFTHALISHALYEGLGSTRRARLHRRVAQTMEQLGQTEGRVNELARHWAAAQPSDVGKAIEYAAAAGRHALGALAPDEAARWFRQAADLAGRLPEPDDRLRSELLLWLGRAQRQAAIPSFRETLLEAARAAEHLGDPGLLARAALANNRGLFSGAGEVDEERVAVLRSALDAVSPDDSAARARLLATLAAELTFDADTSGRRRLSDEALAMARRLGDPTVLVNVLALRFSAIWSADMLDERIANMAEARQAAAATGSATATAWVEALAHMAAVEAGDIEDADCTLERVVDGAERLGMPFLRATAYMYRSSRAIRAGDLAEATRCAHAARSIGLGLGRQEWGSVTGPIFEVYWYQGRLQEMSETLDLEDLEVGEHHARRAWIACRTGDTMTARRLLDAAMDSGVTDRADQWMWLTLMSIWAEVASQVGALEHAAELRAALSPYRDRLAVTASHVYTVVAQPLGMLAALQGDEVAADEHFTEAIAVAERMGGVFHVARAQAAWGAVLIGRRDPHQVRHGEDLLRTALDTATWLGCDGVARDARAALESLARRPPPLPPALRVDGPFPFAGRAGERGAIEAAWADACTGRRRVVVVAGEPGIGKTRLLQELAGPVHDAGGWVAHGRCEEGLTAPYRPFVEALEHLIGHAPDEVIDAHVGRCGSDLARLVPAMSARAGVPGPRPTSDSETERWRLFGAVGDLLQELASRAPLLLVLEDLHWADPGTLSLLRHLLSTDPSVPLLIVATHRDTGTDVAGALADALAALWRAPGVERIGLAGLDEPDFLELMQDLAGHDLGAGGQALARSISRRTGGNPFFATELLRHVEETGAAVADPSGRWAMLGDDATVLPESVRDVVLSRVRRLGEETEQLLTLAAHAGREFDLALVARIAGRSDDDVLDAVERAIRGGLVTEVRDRPDRFAFSHALVVDALTTEFSSARRRRVHGRIAEALEAIGSSPAAEVAHHWVQAGTPAQAREWAVRAADDAAAAVALHDAVRWYETALRLDEEAPSADPGWRCDVMLRLGRAQREAGQAAFRDTLLAATRLARDLGDDHRQIRAALANGRGFLTFTTDVERIEALREALEGAGVEDSTDRARLLVTLAVEVRYAGMSQARALADEALATARRIGDRATLLRVLNMRYPAIDAPETLELRLRDTEEAVALAAELGQPAAEYWALSWRYQTLLETADLDAADRCAERADRLLEQLRRPLQWYDLMRRANRARLAGDLGVAEALGAEGRKQAEATGQPDAAVLTGPDLVHEALLRGRMESAVADLEVHLTDPFARDEVRPSLAHALAGSGRHADAAEIVEEFARSGYETTAGVFQPANMVTWACTVVRLGARDHARAVYDRLLPWSGRAATGGPSVFGMVDHHLGALARVFGQSHIALEHLAAAERAEERMPAPYWLAATRLEQARVLLARGDGDRSHIDDLLRQVAAVARARGFGELDREASALLSMQPTAPP